MAGLLCFFSIWWLGVCMTHMQNQKQVRSVIRLLVGWKIVIVNSCCWWINDWHQRWGPGLKAGAYGEWGSQMLLRARRLISKLKKDKENEQETLGQAWVRKTVKTPCSKSQFCPHCAEQTPQTQPWDPACEVPVHCRGLKYSNWFTKSAPEQ